MHVIAAFANTKTLETGWFLPIDEQAIRNQAYYTFDNELDIMMIKVIIFVQFAKGNDKKAGRTQFIKLCISN
jgi:hypothetical protein